MLSWIHRLYKCIRLLLTYKAILIDDEAMIIYSGNFSNERIQNLAVGLFKAAYKLNHQN